LTLPNINHAAQTIFFFSQKAGRKLD